MKMKYEAYSEYKDSGVEWLGQIPEEWELWKLNHAFDEIGSGTTPPSSSDEWFGGNTPWVTTGELRESVIVDTTKKVTKKTLRQFPTLRKYPKGSIAIAMYGATIGRLGIFGVEATTNQACCVLTKSHFIDNKYLYYWLQAFRQDIVNLASGGGQPNINQEVVASLKISAPDVIQQDRIANFLDHETAKIDTLIEKQQQLIKLLKEKRQAVISHAVTKGLNLDVPMRDSGVEWLGEVPEHWSNIPLKLVVSTRKGVAFKSVDFCDKGIRVVKASDIKEKTIRTTDVFLPDYFEKEYPKAILISGDIILSTVGSNPDVVNSAVGQIGMVPSNLNGTLLNQNTVVFDPEESVILREYLFYILQMEGYRDHLDLHAHGTANQSSLSIVDMLDFIITFPNIEEQRRICDYLYEQQKRLKELESKAETSKALLDERRTALISAAVTGKIDVRNWQAPTAEANNKEAIA